MLFRKEHKNRKEIQYDKLKWYCLAAVMPMPIHPGNYHAPKFTLASVCRCYPAINAGFHMHFGQSQFCLHMIRAII
jgi:hypothetical protein